MTKPNGPRNFKAGGFTNGLWRLEEREAAIRAKPRIQLIGRFHEHTAYTAVVIAIDGQRYEYSLTPIAADDVEYLFRISAGRALALAKRRATSWRKL